MHIDAVAKLLRLTQDEPPSKSGDKAAVEEEFKVLVLDRHTRDLIAPLLKVNDLRRHGVTLHLLLESDRQPIPDVPAVYFVRPSSEHVRRVAADAAANTYAAIHLHFASPTPRSLLEELASETVKADCMGKLACVFDEYLDFLTLERGMFSLGMPKTYVRLNDPSAKDTDVEAAVTAMVDGLFAMLVTLGQVPYIRCPRGGAAEMVAAHLNKKLADHLVTRNNLFTEAGATASFQRPLLCLFDRNFELAVAVQHVWTYQPLVHDVLGLTLNRTTVTAESPGAPVSKKEYTLEDSDPFWLQHSTAAFPKVAEEVEMGLQKYKADVAEVNRKTDVGGDDEADGLLSNTQNLVNAVNSLPELTERKRVIDKHTNIATALLAEIKTRGLDVFNQVEEDMMTDRTDKATMLSLLRDQSKGSATDKLRLAMVYLLSVEATPPKADLDAIEEALRTAGADLAAFAYVKRMRSLNQHASTRAIAATSSAAASQGNLLDLADKLYNQGVSAVTKGVKGLLSGGHQPEVARVVEALMEAKVGPETDAYALFDPKGAKGGAAAAADGGKGRAPMKDAIVFMIGGGNYLEYQSLMEMSARNPAAPKSVVYGSTDILSGHEFVEQLTELGQKMAA